MTAIHAVLLVPEAGDPLGLLAEGPCGSRPPLAIKRRNRGGRWLPWDGRRSTTGGALVLAWDGEPVAEGLDRAARAISRAVEGPLNERAWGRNAALCANDGGLAGLTPYFQFLARLSGGTLVLLDADGREVTP